MVVPTAAVLGPLGEEDSRCEDPLTPCLLPEVVVGVSDKVTVFLPTSRRLALVVVCLGGILLVGLRFSSAIAELDLCVNMGDREVLVA